MKQYEIWWAEFTPPAGRRPVLLLSRDDAYSYLNKLVVAEVTTTVRNIPVEVRLGRKEGLPKVCMANCDNLRTVSRQFLKERIARLSLSRSKEAKRAVGYALGWEELTDIQG